MAKVYALMENVQSNFYDNEREDCIGFFTSEELVTEAANNYLAHCLNNMKDDEKEDFIMPEIPLTFEQLCNSYTYFSHIDKFEAYDIWLYVDEYELDKLKF